MQATSSRLTGISLSFTGTSSEVIYSVFTPSAGRIFIILSKYSITSLLVHRLNFSKARSNSDVLMGLSR